MAEHTYWLGWPYKYDQKKWSIFMSGVWKPWVIPWQLNGLEVTNWQVNTGFALIKAVPTTGDSFYVLYHNDTIKSISTSGNQKVYIELVQSSIDTPENNTLSTAHAEIKVTSWTVPTDNTLILCTDTNSDNPIESRVFAWLNAETINATTLTGLVWDITTTGNIQGGNITATEFIGWGAWITGVSAEINGLTEDNTLDSYDELLFYDDSEWINNKRKAKATTTVPWLVEMATDAEAETWTDEERYVNAKQVKDATTSIIGTAVSKNWFQNYLADTAGLLMVYITPSGGAGDAKVFSDWTATPTAVVATIDHDNNFSNCITVPIIKGNYYRWEYYNNPASFSATFYPLW